MEYAVDLFAILASIATTVCAYVAFKTLYEVKKQRESTYLPDIVIGEENLFVYFRNKNGILEPAEYSYENKGAYFHHLETCDENFYLIKLKFYNIGLATAKQLKIEFFFDEKGIEESLEKSFDSKSRLKVKILEDGFEFFKDEKKLYHGCYEVHEKSNYTGYLMPVTVSGTPFVCEVPNLASSFLLHMIDPTDIYELQDKELKIHPLKPLYVLDGLKVRISYADINDKIHVKCYNLSLVSGWMTGYRIEFKIQTTVVETF